MIALIFKILLPLEILGILLSLVGFALPQVELLLIGLTVLASIFFLHGFIPPPVDVDEKQSQEKSGFFDLFAGTICVKLAWIAASVTLVGGLFRILHLLGAGEMLLIGIPVLMITIIVMGLYTISGKYAARVVPVLYRVVPVCLLGVYLFLH